MDLWATPLSGSQDHPGQLHPQPKAAFCLTVWVSCRSGVSTGPGCRGLRAQGGGSGLCRRPKAAGWRPREEPLRDTKAGPRSEEEEEAGVKMSNPGDVPGIHLWCQDRLCLSSTRKPSFCQQMSACELPPLASLSFGCPLSLARPQNPPVWVP